MVERFVYTEDVGGSSPPSPTAMQQVQIIYEDVDVLVINKPAGLVVHSDGRTKEHTLADWLMENYPDSKDVGEGWENDRGDIIARPGIVHRLDKDTSGVMIIAKTQEVFEYLKEQFKERKVKKIYHAFVVGKFKEEGGTIDKQIGKSKSDFRKWSAQPGSRGVKRNAVTHWKILNRWSSDDHLLDVSLLELKPETGRTHQLRVHLKAVHHPIVCDKLYGSKTSAKEVCPLGLDRQALHARELTLVLLSGEEKTFTAEYPKDFENALEYGTFAQHD